jgi:hypothetical protein
MSGSRRVLSPESFRKYEPCCDRAFPRADLEHASSRHRVTRTEVAYGVASLTAAQASPERAAGLTRGHWEIERLHWVRDVTFGEDASRIRTGQGPRSWPRCAT